MEPDIYGIKCYLFNLSFSKYIIFIGLFTPLKSSRLVDVLLLIYVQNKINTYIVRHIYGNVITNVIFCFICVQQCRLNKLPVDIERLTNHSAIIVQLMFRGMCMCCTVENVILILFFC